MKIGIISDTHDHIELTRKALQKIEELGCAVLIHCGDFCAPFMIKELAEFSGEVHCCFGNTNDKPTSEKVAKEEGVNLYGDIGEIEMDGKKIVFNHFPEKAEELAASGKYDLVLHGHTHETRQEKVGDTWLINPGEIMGWRGASTFAIYDTVENSIEIITL